MARLILTGSGNVTAGTTKTLTMYAPVGFKVITAGFESVGDGTDVLLASHPVFYTSNGLAVSKGTEGSDFGYADGSTAKPNPLEGWVWKVKNTSGSNHNFYVSLIVTESDEITLGGEETYSWPTTVA